MAASIPPMNWFTETLPTLLSWYQQAELSSLLSGEYNTEIAIGLIVLLIALWIFTRILRALVGTALLVCVLYLAVKLVLGIDPLPYLLP